MPKLARKTGHVDARKPFGVYDGPEPPRGNYLAEIKSVSLRAFETGAICFNVLTVFSAPAGTPKAEFNGYSTFTKLFIGEHEAQLARENAFYTAICGNPNPDVVYDKEPKPGQGGDAKVTKIGGQDPVGKIVRVDLRLEEYPKGSGEFQRQGDAIYAADPADVAALGGKAPKASADVDPDADPDAEPEAKPTPRKRATSKKAAAPAPEKTPEPASEVTVEAEVDYAALPLPKLKAAARGLGIDVAGKTKGDLLDEITDKLADSAPADDEPGEAAQDAEWAEDYVPTQGEVEALSDDAFWSWAASKYQPGDVTPEDSSREEITDMVIEDGYATAF